MSSEKHKQLDRLSYEKDKFGNRVYKSRRPAWIPSKDWNKWSENKKLRTLDHIEQNADFYKDLAAPAEIPGPTTWNDCVRHEQNFVEDLHSTSQNESQRQSDNEAADDEGPAAPLTRAERHQIKRRQRRHVKEVAAAMPCQDHVPLHRPKYHNQTFMVPACVARPVGKKEIDKNAKAKAAQGAEWKRFWER